MRKKRLNTSIYIYIHTHILLCFAIPSHCSSRTPGSLGKKNPVSSPLSPEAKFCATHASAPGALRARAFRGAASGLQLLQAPLLGVLLGDEILHGLGAAELRGPRQHGASSAQGSLTLVRREVKRNRSENCFSYLFVFRGGRCGFFWGRGGGGNFDLEKHTPPQQLSQIVLAETSAQDETPFREASLSSFRVCLRLGTAGRTRGRFCCLTTSSEDQSEKGARVRFRKSSRCCGI